MSFEHRKDDVTATIRFREDTWKFLEAKIYDKKHKPNMRQARWKLSGTPKKSVHTVLDELLRKLMEDESI